MKNIARLFSKKSSAEDRQMLMEKAALFIRDHVNPVRIIFFGSIQTDQFDAQSDIDVVVICPSQQDADHARKRLYGIPQPNLGHPLEMICVSEEIYRHNSQIGGIYFVAAESGKEF